jgi:RHS repeat-associated protein
MTSVTNNCGVTNYTWNARNRLVGINGFKPDCSTLTASFKYDALGRRIEKTINGVTTRYFYDGLDIIQEKNASGAVTANYIRTLNIDEPLTRIKGSTVRHYVKDALGSVIALTDDTGVVRTTYTYDPFGNVTVSGETSDNPFQYTGRENDGTGLYYYRARYYSPELQRFISEDPIRLAGGDVNYYAYVGNNPVNVTDPSGKGPILFGVCISLTIADTIDTGYELSEALDKVAELQKEKAKRTEKCDDTSLPANQREKNLNRINEIDKEIIKISRGINKSGLWGIAKALGLTLLCGLALTP